MGRIVRYGQRLWMCLSARAALFGGVSILFAVNLGAVSQASATSLSWSSPAPLDTRPLTAVACVSVSLCIAGDDEGGVVATTSPEAGAGSWTKGTLNPLATEPILGLSCPSTTLCVAGGEYSVLTSTDPAGPASGWTQQTTEPQHPFEKEETHFGPLASVSCASASLCVADLDPGNDFDALASSTNPTGGSGAWTSTTPFLLGDHSRTPILGVSCATQSFCAAVDGAGDVIVSADPGSSGSGWTTTPVVTDALRGISCPDTSLCVAVDDSGDAVVSTDPTGGSSAWTSYGIDGGNSLTAISCASGFLCAAVDANGKVLVSTDPAAGPASWTPVAVDAGRALTAVSCTTAELCVVVDSAGYESTGTPAPQVIEGGDATAGGVLASSSSTTSLPPSITGTSGALRISRIKTERGGRIDVTVQVPAAGTATVVATTSIARAVGSRTAPPCKTRCLSKIPYGKASVDVRRADTLDLTIKPSKRALGALRSSRLLRVPIKAVFTPRNGAPTDGSETVSIHYRPVKSSQQR
jgi:hypothetical protein